MIFCFNCGFSVSDSDKFCSECGISVKVRESPVKSSFEEYTFSSNMLLGGNILTPDKLLIGKTGVEYEKRNSYLIGVDTLSISYKKISSVEIDRGLISADIYIKGFGSETIKLENFTLSSAKKIKTLIESRI